MSLLLLRKTPLPTQSLLCLIAILAVAFALRIYQLDAHGVYLDEKFTLISTQGIVQEGSNQRDVFFTPGKTYFTPKEFWKTKTLADINEAIIRSDISNSPAYTGLLALWIKAFGISDFSVRMLSVLFSLATVWLIFSLATQYTHSIRIGLISAALAASEPFFVAYSHVARAYSMTIFVSLLATWLFLRILERQRTGKPAWGLYVGYGLAYAASVLGHTLGLIIFLAHGLYLLFYVRDWRTYLTMSFAWAIATIVLLVPWFTVFGGKYLLTTMAYQAQFYRHLAETNPLNNGFGIIHPATVANVFRALLPIITDLFWITNGLHPDVLGFRNASMELGTGLLALGIVWFFGRGRTSPTWVKLGVPLLLVSALAAVTIRTGQAVVLAALPLFVYSFYQSTTQLKTGPERRFLTLLGLLLALPLVFLLVITFRNGHTFGITQRYASFSFPYAVILVAMLVDQLPRLPRYLGITLGLAVAVQGYYVMHLDQQILADTAPKYTQFATPRIKNPYTTAARTIQKLYAPGDTILYPAPRMTPADEVEKTCWPFSIKDAQMTNLYLPKEATYLQRMDTTQTDQIWLLKGQTKDRLLVFDFKGTTYRY